MYSKPKFLLVILFATTVLSANTLDGIAETYFKSSEYQRMVQNPSGQYFAAETYYNAQEHIEIVNLKQNKSYVIFNGTNGVKVSIVNIQWIDEDSLIVQFNLLKEQSSHAIFKVIHLKYDKIVSVESTFEFEKRGFIVDNLVNSENKIYFAHILNSKKYSSGIYKVDLTSKQTAMSGLHFNTKIGPRISKPFYWIVGENKTIRLILSEVSKKVYYWIFKNQHWSNVAVVDEDSDDFVYPLALNSQNQYIVIKRLKDKDRKGVYLLNANSLSVEKVLYYSKDFDVESIQIHPESSEIIAINYIKNGVRKNVILDDKLRKAQQLLTNNYPKFKSAFLSNDSNFTTFLFVIHNFQNEGIYVNVNLNKGTVKKIIEKAAWRKPLAKGRLEVVDYINQEQLKIESYLSVPETGDVKALLVMPHGGPIGARSYGYFDSLSHFLASYGIAVLKINYRGSSGFGKKFEDAGKKQWGDKIEKDINDVVTHVVKKFNLDEDKICSGGSSYGGYSALMLHINYPKRYKCIISLAGPTDLPLMFTSSDWNINKESIKSMIEIVGGPHHDIDKLKAQSPVYNVKNIHAPVLLFHGKEDLRVSVEHSIRLEYILKKFNKPVDVYLIKDEKHGFHLLKNQVLHATELLKFMNRILELNLSIVEENSETKIFSIEQ